MDSSFCDALFRQWDIALSDIQLNQFMKYYELLVEWNSFINLTSITDYEDVCLKHFLDSVSIIKAYDIERLKNDSLSLIDVGTGAGFPGIPLKIVFPNLRVTLLDSLNKRVSFLNEVIHQLSLCDITAYHGRAEDYAKKDAFRQQYDLCVSRAVANLSTLSEYCLPFIRIGGYFVSYKSEKINEEAKMAKKAITILGGTVDHQTDFILPGSDMYRCNYVIYKSSNTPKKYPRKAGLPSKEPLFHVKQESNN